jgi:hypothetical protein
VHNIQHNACISSRLGTITNTVVDAVDVDGVVRQIDVDDVLNRIDIDHLLDRVDLNRHLHRVDMDALLARVDIDALLERSKIDQIIARSSAGVCTACVDLIRNNLAWCDQWIQRLFRLACFSKEPWLPPRPGVKGSGKTPWPKGSKNLGLALQGRCAGTTSRGLSWSLDAVVVALTFFSFSLLVNLTGEVITGDPNWKIQKDWIIPVTYFLYWTTYQILCLSCLGRTLGNAVFGLLLVNFRGHRPNVCQIVIRIFTIPLNITFFGYIISLVRRDANTYNDFLSRTTMVYMWDAKLALLRGGVGISSMSSPYLDEEHEEKRFSSTVQDSAVIDEEDPIQKDK